MITQFRVPILMYFTPLLIIVVTTIDLALSIVFSPTKPLIYRPITDIYTC